MRGLYEDIDEDIDEADDEDVDEAVGADADDEGLSERRRRRRGPKVRGRGYVGGGRPDGRPVTQEQLKAATTRIGEDVRKLAAGVKAAEDRRAAGDRAQRGQTQNLGMMSALLPLLTRKTITFKEASDNPATKLVSGESDMLGLLLPFMMLGGMGGQPGQSNGAAAGGMDPMMGMMMVMMMSGGLGGSK